MKHIIVAAAIAMTSTAALANASSSTVTGATDSEIANLWNVLHTMLDAKDQKIDKLKAENEKLKKYSASKSKQIANLKASREDWKGWWRARKEQVEGYKAAVSEAELEGAGFGIKSSADVHAGYDATVPTIVIPADIEDAASYEAGYEDGYTTGYNNGFKDGWNSAVEFIDENK